MYKSDKNKKLLKLLVFFTLATSPFFYLFISIYALIYPFYKIFETRKFKKIVKELNEKTNVKIKKKKDLQEISTKIDPNKYTYLSDEDIEFHEEQIRKCLEGDD